MLDPLAIRVDKMLKLAQVASLRDNRRESLVEGRLESFSVNDGEPEDCLRTNDLRLMSFMLRLSRNQLQRMR
jgi:hypothetical protein